MSIMTQATADVLCTVFQQELQHGKENWPNGTDPRYFKRDKDSTFLAATNAAKAGQLTFSHLLLTGAYSTLASANDAELRRNLVYLTAQMVIWLESIDRREPQAVAA